MDNTYKCSECVNRGSVLCNLCTQMGDRIPTQYVRQAEVYEKPHNPADGILTCIKEDKPIPAKWFLKYNHKFRSDDK